MGTLSIDSDRRTDLGAQAVLDALIDSTVILDSAGVIRLANRPWISFAENNGAHSGMVSTGADYLQVCDESAAHGCLEASDAAGCIRRVLSGDVDQCFMEYECSSPTQRRWFVMRVAAVAVDSDTWAMVSHLDVSRRHRAERKVDVASMWAGTQDPPFSVPALTSLSRSELRVVTALMRGESVSVIAARSFVSASTVRSQLSAAFRKLGVASQRELVDLIRAELVTLSQ